MKTRTQRLTSLADQMEANIMHNLVEYRSYSGESIAQQVSNDIDMFLAMAGEADPICEEHYFAGPNYNKALVMYCATGDHGWLPEARDDHHYD